MHFIGGTSTPAVASLSVSRRELVTRASTVPLGATVPARSISVVTVTVTVTVTATVTVTVPMTGSSVEGAAVRSECGGLFASSRTSSI